MHTSTARETTAGEPEAIDRRTRGPGRRRTWIAWTIYLAVLAAVAALGPGGP